MSYPMGLDEYSEERLLQELLERAKSREQGLCDYCNREPSTPSCKFPERHSMRGRKP